MDMAQQFLSTVANNSQVVYWILVNDLTIESVLLYTLREEIKATAKAGLDSGLDQNNFTIIQYVNHVIAFNFRFATDIVPCWSNWVFYPAALRRTT